MQSTEHRFAHMLQPIRELTKNWEIDVASELNDYLEELDEMCITFDGGQISLNFAEAALLIQGSTCIYSKKVELLHSLVYQTLDYINDKKKRQNKELAGSQEGATAASNNDDEEEGEEATFVLLDIDASEKSMIDDMNTTVNLDPLPPESLIPLEASEKSKLPLISVDGKILCSQKDFRINLFIPGEDNMILLTERSAASRFCLENDQHGADVLQQRHTDMMVPCVDADVAGAEDAEFDAAENFMPLEDMEQGQEPEEHVDRQQAPRAERMFEERRQVEKPSREEQAAPAVNVWKFHDLYAVVGQDKPFKSGKCYKVPDGLDDRRKRKRKEATSLQDFRSWFRGAFDPPEHKLRNGPTFTDLNYIYLSTVKDKLKTRRRIYRKAGLVVSDEEIRKTFLQPEEPQQQGEDPVDDFRHLNLLGGDDENSDNEHEAFPDDVPAEFSGGAEAQNDELSYEDLVRLRVDQLVVNCRAYTQETALSRRVKEWEDKIRPELVLQEERPAFHIHDYGDRIVGALANIGTRRAFSSIVHGLDNFEACKYLLASLQLANDYTVEIDSVEDLEESVDSMGLTLLSTNRATDRFKTLTATASH